MSIGSRNCERTASFALEPITFQLGTTAVSQTGLKTAGMTVKYAFQIVSAEVFCVTTAATITVDVQIGAVSALAAPVAPVAATPTNLPLSATLANTQSKVPAVLNLLYTSNGSGAATNAVVTVWVRPLGMHGDAYRAAL